MKRAFLTIFAVLILASCGGGGGGNTPTVQMPDNPPVQMPDNPPVQMPGNPTVVITPEQQTEARELATMLRGEVANLESSEEANSLLAKIDDLLAEIENAQTKIEKLRAEIAELRANFEMVQMADNTDMQINNDGNDNPQMDDMTTPIETRPINEFDSLEFRRNPVLSLANPLPAYERGFFGQGVTVMVRDVSFLQTHEDLESQWVLDDYGLSGQENRFYGGTHGTNSAGIIGAVRGNGKGSHGIAPSVRILPLDNTGSNLPIILSLMVSLDIPISSHSYIRTLSMYPYSDITVITENEIFIRGARGWANILGDHDHIMVWGAGNGGQNTPPVQFRNIWGHYPLIEKELEDNFLIVVALHRGNTIDNHSDGCGVGKMWCIGAIGDGNLAPSGSFYNMLDNYNEAINTSAATPVVSGALALLKSFRPELKMTVIRQVLLESARPLGTRKNDGMPDEVFGWGAVDVGNGIATLQAMQTADGMAYSDLRKSLPSEFSHLRGRMESVSVALRITDRSYYNMRLSDIVGGGDSQKTSLGNAAKEMQADDSLSPENAGFGFNYANGDYDLHYAGGGNENAFRFSGGLRHDDSQSSYIGEGSSPFAAENASDTGGYVKWTTKNYGGISAFGEYGRTQIKADYDSNSFVSKIQNARAEEWTAGFQYQNLFLHNDNLQFSARQESRISGGEMVLHYPVADGDSHKAFIGETVQTIRTETARIPIKQKPQTIYTAGYSQKTENSKWSAAAEWNSATNAKGVSFVIELQIR